MKTKSFVDAVGVVLSVMGGMIMAFGLFGDPVAMDMFGILEGWLSKVAFLGVGLALLICGWLVATREEEPREVLRMKIPN